MPVTNYIWDGENYLQETDENGLTQATYTNKPEQFGKLVSQRRASETGSEFFHYDALGSTTELTDESETVTESYRYEAFGEQQTTNTYTPPFVYVGESGYYNDEETNDFYVRMRSYAPKIGRWIGADVLRYTDGPNLYIYVHDDPINKRDPSGELCFTTTSYVPFDDVPGRFEWKIEFVPQSEREKTGFIVQEVRLSQEIRDCKTKKLILRSGKTCGKLTATRQEGDPVEIRFWEIWVINDGIVGRVIHAGNVYEGLHFLRGAHDEFGFSGTANPSCGYIRQSGRVWFVPVPQEDFDDEKRILLPGKLDWNAQVDVAGLLDSSCEQPAGFTSVTLGVFRSVEKRWNWCEPCHSETFIRDFVRCS